MNIPVYKYNRETHKAFIDVLSNGLPTDADGVPAGTITAGELSFKIDLEPIGHYDDGAYRCIPVLRAYWANKRNCGSELTEKGVPYVGIGTIPYKHVVEDYDDFLTITKGMIIDFIRDIPELEAASASEVEMW